MKLNRKENIESGSKMVPKEQPNQSLYLMKFCLHLLEIILNAMAFSAEEIRCIVDDI